MEVPFNNKEVDGQIYLKLIFEKNKCAFDKFDFVALVALIPLLNFLERVNSYGIL